MDKVLVSGGAGYIGSHTVDLLKEEGFAPYVIDDLSTGHREAIEGIPLYVVDLRNKEKVERVIREISPVAVIHFASHCYVGESVENPRKYFEDNLSTALNLLGAMLDNGVGLFIFSSSCATYGIPGEIPIPEDHPRNPVNPYGETKYFIERILERYKKAYSLKYAALRYFNAAGAHPKGKLGESHDPETHLIPLMIKAIRDPEYTLTVFGDDYPTEDGTCIRDYVHVTDLAYAHIKAMEYLLKGGTSQAFNLGTGRGYSVKQMIGRLEKITGLKVKYKIGSRRAGDPARLVARAEKARHILNWHPEFSDIETILESAWQWHCKQRF